MRRTLNIFIGLGLFLAAIVGIASWGVNVALAQGVSEEQAAEKHGVKFPITELGGCKNISECRSFCDDPVNNTVCIEYAKQKGFYKPEQQEENKQKALSKAKGELGCDSEVSCRNLCEQSANYDRCSSFAKKYELGGGQLGNPAGAPVVEKAKETLGCDNVSDCKGLCEQEQNRQKCSEFARQAGLRGGEMRSGPGGCTNEQTCRTFCSDPSNYTICKSYAAAGSGAKFSGPGGCDSEESCKSYCEKNPKECGFVGQYQENVQKYNPVDMCNRTSGCYWGNNTCTCSGAPGVDNGSAVRRGDPAQECVKYNGCVWFGGTCKCSTPVSTSGEFNKEEYKNSCNAGGCKWTGNGCDCAGTDGPAIECGKKGCMWMDLSCKCGGYNMPSNSSMSPGPSQPASNNSGSYGNRMSREQQEYYCKTGGGACDWNANGICNCKGYSAPVVPTAVPVVNSGGGSYSPASPGGNSGSSGTNNYGNSMSREQQEAGCRAGGGTCDWSNGSWCNCRGYVSPNPNGGGSPPAGSMTRESQEAGCRACGGSCNWNGDMCNCQCGSPQPQSQSSNPPAQNQYDPAAQCAASGGSWDGSTCKPKVQGAETSRSWWEWLLGLWGK